MQRTGGERRVAKSHTRAVFSAGNVLFQIVDRQCGGLQRGVSSKVQAETPKNAEDFLGALFLSGVAGIIRERQKNQDTGSGPYLLFELWILNGAPRGRE